MTGRCARLSAGGRRATGSGTSPGWVKTRTVEPGAGSAPGGPRRRMPVSKTGVRRRPAVTFSRDVPDRPPPGVPGVVDPLVARHRRPRSCRRGVSHGGPCPPLTGRMSVEPEAELAQVDQVDTPLLSVGRPGTPGSGAGVERPGTRQVGRSTTPLPVASPNSGTARTGPGPLPAVSSGDRYAPPACRCVPVQAGRPGHRPVGDRQPVAAVGQGRRPAVVVGHRVGLRPGQERQGDHRLAGRVAGDGRGQPDGAAADPRQGERGGRVRVAAGERDHPRERDHERPHHRPLGPAAVDRHRRDRRSRRVGLGRPDVDPPALRPAAAPAGRSPAAGRTPGRRRSGPGCRPAAAASPSARRCSAAAPARPARR